jgi:OOP family OmpA-OmpF porin
MKKTVLTLGIMSAAFALPALADDTGWNVTANVGRSHFGGDFNVPGASVSRNGTAAGLGLGYSFSKNVGVELGYEDFGKASLNGTVSGDAKAKATHVSLLLTAPLENDFSIYGRVGAARTDRSVSGTFSGSEKKNEALYGVGFGYAFTKSIGGTLEWQKLDNTKASALTAGVKFSF